MKVTPEDIAAFKTEFYFNAGDETDDPVEIGLKAVFALRDAAQPEMPAGYIGTVGEIIGDTADHHRVSYQRRVMYWAAECFGPHRARDPFNRRNRFLEEAVELFQACGGSRENALDLIAYVFSRPTGEVSQEIGGVMLTLAALSEVSGCDMMDMAVRELDRVHENIAAIRAKDAARPDGSVCPVAPPPQTHVTATYALRLVAAYDDLLRTYTGPSNTLCASDVTSIDDAYDAMVVAVRAALAAIATEVK